VGCELEAIPWICRRNLLLVRRFLAAKNEVLEGDLSQNAASGKRTAFA
jgi:hypothetical protein